MKSKVKSNVKSGKFFLIVFLLLAIFFAFFRNFSNFLPNNFLIWVQTKFSSFSKGEDFYNEEESASIIPRSQGFMDGNIVLLKDSGFFVLNRNCRKIFSDKFAFESPKVKIAGLRSIVYDAGRTGYKIYTIFKSLFSGESENQIVSGAISDSGVYGFATKSKSHLSEMSVFDADNHKIFSYFFADRFVSDISISKKGNESAISGYKIADGIFESAVYVLNHRSEEPKKILNFPDEMVFRVEYLSNGNLAILSEQNIRILTAWFCNLKEYSFDDKILNCFEVRRDGNITLCMSDTNDGRNCEVVCLNQNLSEIALIKTDLRVTDVTQRNEVICLLCGEQVYCYSTSGELIKTLKILPGAEKISLVTNSKICVVGDEKLMILDL